MSNVSLHAAFLLLALFVCANRGWAADLPFRTLAQGSNSGIVRATNQVLRTQAEWEKLWKAHQGMIDPPAKVPVVAFEKEMVVAVAMGRKRTGGYAIQIKRIETSPASLKIIIAQRTPGPDALVTQALSAPFHFVSAPKSDLKPEFVIEAGP